MELSKNVIKRYLLLYQGLLGDYQFEGKNGVMGFVQHVTALQYDPIDVCGRNAEIILQSRVKNFEKSMLSELLYQDRVLIDYFDKCLCIFPVSDFPFLKNRVMYYYKSSLSADKIKPISEQVCEIIKEKGAVCSKDLDFSEKVEWYWNDTKLSRAVLEQLYYSCVVGISHKKGTIKYYDLIENCVLNPRFLKDFSFENEKERLQWHILRRIKAVGMMWQKPSDVWLNIEGLTAKNRKEVFGELIEKNLLFFADVDKIRYYFPTSVKSVLDSAMEDTNQNKRCEFIAPLDSLLWDRKLIKEIFSFDYKWEIYTAKDKRKYGYYVLPIVYGEDFIGRIEMICGKKAKTLTDNHLWLEDGVRLSEGFERDLDLTLLRFAKFNECEFCK